MHRRNHINSSNFFLGGLKKRWSRFGNCSHFLDLIFRWQFYVHTYNSKPQNQMSEWTKDDFFWYAKILTKAFLHDSHIWFWIFFTLLVALAHGVTHTQLTSTKRFTNPKVNFKHLRLYIGAKIKLVSYDFEYFHQCIMTFWGLRDSKGPILGTPRDPYWCIKLI